MPEEITIEEYRRLTKRTKGGGAALPSVPQGQRASAGWVADYEEAGGRGWSFSTDCVVCWAWRGKERTGDFAYLGTYASPAGVYRLAVVAALKRG